MRSDSIRYGFRPRSHYSFFIQLNVGCSAHAWPVQLLTYHLIFSHYQIIDYSLLPSPWRHHLYSVSIRRAIFLLSLEGQTTAVVLKDNGHLQNQYRHCFSHQSCVHHSHSVVVASESSPRHLVITDLWCSYELTMVTI